MNTSKPGVRLIAEICRQKGIVYAVFSPGSRSAPLVIAFSQIAEIECIVVPDERVAGYFALGLAQQTQKPVAVICTSGTAVLNLGPSLCEAYYQHIPMLFLTADRPVEAEERGENQAINQAFLFREMTRASYDVDADVTDAVRLENLGRQVERGIDESMKPVPGPVHLNIRMNEPLYEFTSEPDTKFEILKTAGEKSEAPAVSIKEFQEQLNKSTKRLIVIGMHQPDETSLEKLTLLSRREDTVVLIETASNAAEISGAISNYDGCLDLIDIKHLSDFIPDVVITLGNQIISKKLRQLLKANKPLYHWDVSPYGEHRKHDIFDIPTNVNPITEKELLGVMMASEYGQSDFSKQWHSLSKHSGSLTDKYLRQIDFCDLTVFELLANAYPTKAHVQYGNSTPVRYSNIFCHGPSVRINSNRGASGIDGSVSTACGAAWATRQLTICVVGDVSFFYDSNALWNNCLSPDLRIIVINNSGGNIFRLLNGPTKVGDFEKFFETRHNLSAKYLAEMYAIPYYFCDHQERLEKILATFFLPHNGKAAILEIKTDGTLSAEVYKRYFEYLAENKAAL